MTDPKLALVGMILLVLFMGVSILRMRRRRSSPDSRPGTFDAESSGIREDMERLLAEMQEFSREQIARLDTKIRMINQLLQDCDQKKKDLETLLGRIGNTTLAKLEPPAPPRPANPLHDQVYALHDQGKNPHEISTATGLEKGEIDLILGLRKMSSGGR